MRNPPFAFLGDSKPSPVGSAIVRMDSPRLDEWWGVLFGLPFPVEGGEARESAAAATTPPETLRRGRHLPDRRRLQYRATTDRGAESSTHAQHDTDPWQRGTRQRAEHGRIGSAGATRAVAKIEAKIPRRIGGAVAEHWAGIGDPLELAVEFETVGGVDGTSR